MKITIKDLHENMNIFTFFYAESSREATNFFRNYNPTLNIKQMIAVLVSIFLYQTWGAKQG